MLGTFGRILLPFFCFIRLTNTAKILFLYWPLYSNILHCVHIADRLIENGHEVWFTTTDELAHKFKFSERRLHKVPFNESDEFLNTVKNISVVLLHETLSTGEFSATVKAFQPILDVQLYWLKDQLFLSTVEKENFDLVILTSNPFTEMLSVIPYKYNIPFILYGPYYDPVKFGIPFSPAFVSHPLLPYSHNMNFQERFVNMVNFLYLYAFDLLPVPDPLPLAVPEKPNVSLRDILRKAELCLLQWDYLLKDPVPLLPHVILISQINKQKVSQVPDKFQTFMDRSSQGVVIFSFGSHAPVKDGPIFSKLISAFLDTQFDFILKGNLSVKSERLLVSDWIPQASLLTHKNVKLFISHCGLNGLSEALYNQVPILGFPLFADQDGNAAKMKAKGFGEVMHISLDSKEDLTRQINEVITNSKYKENIKRAVERFKDMEKDSLSEAVYWIEHVLKYGGDHLKSSSLNMPLYQLLLLDILLFVLISLIVVTVLIYKCIVFLFIKKMTKTKSKTN